MMLYYRHVIIVIIIFIRKLNFPNNNLFSFVFANTVFNENGVVDIVKAKFPNSREK